MPPTKTAERPAAATFSEDRSQRFSGSAQPSPASDDPFQAIAEAMEAAAREAERQEAPKKKADKSGPRKAAAGPAPSSPSSASASGAMYSVAYGIGFGVAFPAFFVMGLLPSDSAMARGLRDGAKAARESLGE